MARFDFQILFSSTSTQDQSYPTWQHCAVFQVHGLGDQPIRALILGLLLSSTRHSCLSFLTCKIGIMTVVSTSKGHMKSKSVNIFICKTLFRV